MTFLVELVFFLLFASGIAYVIFRIRKDLRESKKTEARKEALFVSMFPDLQPYFHPKKLIAFVRARRAAPPPPGGKVWTNPPGFGVDAAAIRMDNGRETVHLRDAAGAVRATFVYEEHAEGGVIRFGKGKFTVRTREAEPRVNYWHPDREFKWSRPKGWRLVTRMADEPFSGSGSSESSSSNSSGSWSDTSRTAAAAGAAGVAVAGAGGAFDGGGASQGWDDANSGATAPSATSY